MAEESRDHDFPVVGFGSRIMSSSDLARHLLVIGSFIGWHDDRYMQGGYTAAEAFSALCSLFGFEQDAFRARIIGDEDGGSDPPR